MKSRSISRKNNGSGEKRFFVLGYANMHMQRYTEQDRAKPYAAQPKGWKSWE